MKSILQDKEEGYCLLCFALYGDRSRKTCEEHHVMFGMADRKLSEKYGLKVYLCPQHHRTSKEAVHKDRDINESLRKMAQRAFERDHTRKEWMETFRVNYLDA